MHPNCHSLTNNMMWTLYFIVLQTQFNANLFGRLVGLLTPIAATFALLQYPIISIRKPPQQQLDYFNLCMLISGLPLLLALRAFSTARATRAPQHKYDPLM